MSFVVVVSVFSHCVEQGIVKVTILILKNTLG